MTTTIHWINATNHFLKTYLKRAIQVNMIHGLNVPYFAPICQFNLRTIILISLYITRDGQNDRYPLLLTPLDGYI